MLHLGQGQVFCDRHHGDLVIGVSFFLFLLVYLATRTWFTLLNLPLSALRFLISSSIYIRNLMFKSNFPICMLAQKYLTLLVQTRSVCGLSIAHELSIWEFWVRTSSKVSCSPHCLWIYDFPRFNKIHFKSSKLYAFRQLSCTHPGEFWVAEASWKCIILHTISVLEKPEMKGRASRWQERIAWVSASMS